MRWRFVDRIERMAPWRSIRGRKSLSFEEYNLLAPFGREGVLPETLIIETCVQLVRWLAIGSSDFRQIAVLSGLEGFAFEDIVGMGDVLTASASVKRRDEHCLDVDCRILVGDRPVGKGTVLAALEDLAPFYCRESVEIGWRSLYVEA